jgi:hypothetical protein
VTYFYYLNRVCVNSHICRTIAWYIGEQYRPPLHVRYLEVFLRDSLPEDTFPIIYFHKVLHVNEYLALEQQLNYLITRLIYLCVALRFAVYKAVNPLPILQVEGRSLVYSGPLIHYNRTRNPPFAVQDASFQEL